MVLLFKRQRTIFLFINLALLIISVSLVNKVCADVDELSTDMDYTDENLSTTEDSNTEPSSTDEEYNDSNTTGDLNTQSSANTTEPNYDYTDESNLTTEQYELTTEQDEDYTTLNDMTMETEEDPTTFNEITTQYVTTQYQTTEYFYPDPNKDDYDYEYKFNSTDNVINSDLLFIGDSQPRPGLGINVGTITYGMSQWVFVNKFKHAREWRPVKNLYNDWYNYTLCGVKYSDCITTTWDSNQWPTTFNNQPSVGVTAGWMTQVGTDGLYPTGDYILTWQGTGNITLVGDPANITYVDTNKIAFNVNVTSTQGITIIVTSQDVSEIDLREKRDENSTDTFSSSFLNALRPFEALRFSSWMINRNGITIANANTEWSTRRPTTYYTQVGQKMVSIEYIIELANVLSKDIWLSIPSSASDDFISNMANYVKTNLANQSATIYLEFSSEKGLLQNNKTGELNLIQLWNAVSDTRVKHVLAISFYDFFNNTASYSAADYANFDYFSVSGAIGHKNPYTGFNGTTTLTYNVSLSSNFTITDILDEIRQQIFVDEIDLIYLIQSVKYLINKPLIAYDVGFRVKAPTNNRALNTSLANMEQNLENLIIQAMGNSSIKDLYLDFMERWYRIGGGLMFLSNIVDKVDNCNKNKTNETTNCGYYSTMTSLLQTPQTVPKYNAALYWLNARKGNLPLTYQEPVPVLCKVKCYWGVCYQGACVCYSGFNGTFCNETIPKYLDCSSNATHYGMNMISISDGSPEVVFTNIHRRARPWIVQKIVYSTKWADWNQSDVQLTVDGYPKYLEIGKTVGTFLVRDVNGHFPTGKYVCIYDGDGVLDFSGFDATVTRRDAGRVEFQVTSWSSSTNNGLYYNIIRTNPSNPVRNIRIFESRFESTYRYFPYHPLFLEFMKKYSVIRFMGWSNINTDQIADWSTRTNNSYFTFQQREVSIEMQVRLCNLLGSSPWFNLPHRATNEYLINWAQYVRDNLRPDVKIYIEFGNECWNSDNLCGSYAQEMGLAENLTIIRNQSLYPVDLQARICYHAQLGRNYSELIKSVFNNGTFGNSSRIKFVFNTQTSWLIPLEIFFLCPDNVSLSYDMIALAPYMTDNMTYSDGNLMSINDFYNTRISASIRNSINQLSNAVNLTLANNRLMEIGLYGSGPDFSAAINSSYNIQLTYSIHRDTRMYSALTSYFSNITTISNIKVLNYYASSGPCANFSCWGIMESSDANVVQSSPKYKAFNDFINSKKICNWKDAAYTCPSNCSSVGLCAKSTALSSYQDKCYCYYGYQSVANNTCQLNYIVLNQCTDTCGGHGTCSFDHYDGVYAVYTCHCAAGYYGYGCQQYSCSTSCNYNGVCTGLNTCKCFKGYKGSTCGVDCGCNGHGVCSNTTNACICDEGYLLIGGKCYVDCEIADSRLECSNCSALCIYGDCYWGECYCWAGYTLDMRGQCTLRIPADNDGSKLGINLNAATDSSTQWSFLDIGKTARKWIIQYLDYYSYQSVWALNDFYNLTTENYPSYITANRQMASFMLNNVQQHWPNSLYRVMYDGEGVLEFANDAKIVDQTEKYKITIAVNLTTGSNNGIYMKLKKTNPSNPLRNIRIVLDGFETNFTANPFHPVFLDRLRLFKTLRFTAWTQQDDINGMPITNWTQRITQTSFGQGTGVPYEDMIHLCNILKTNCWFTVPYAAADNFVTQLANLVKNRLRNDVKVYVEYTIDALNPLSVGGKYCTNKGLQLSFSTNPDIARDYYYSLRSNQIIKLWKGVYGSSSSLLTLVVNSRLETPQSSSRILAFNGTYNSHSNVMLAIGGYITCGNPSPSMVAFTNTSLILDACESDLPNQQALIQAHINISTNYSVRIGMYESGSDLVEKIPIETSIETPGATDKYIAINQDEQMYTIYKSYYNMFSGLSLTENCHYGYVSLPSKYAVSGLLEYQDQDVVDAPKYKAILEMINQTKAYVAPLTNYTCSNESYVNVSAVCGGNGICVSQNTCKNFSTPYSQSSIIITPGSGVGLTTTFYIRSLPWITYVPMSYAFGINISTYGYVRLTEYTDLPSVISFLPYHNTPLQIVIFAKDILGNIYTSISSQRVYMYPYPGTVDDLDALSQNFTAMEKIMMLFDTSPASDQRASDLALKVNLTGNNTAKELINLEALTTFNTDGPLCETIRDKMNAFFRNISTNLLSSDYNSSTMISVEQTQTCANILSNIYLSGQKNITDSIFETLTNMLLINGTLKANQTEQNSVPYVSFTTKAFKYTVAAFNLTSYQNDNIYIPHEDVSLNLSEIFSNVSADTFNGGISIVKYFNRDPSLFATDQIDLKFFAGTTHMTNVSGLTNPILLRFKIENTQDLSKDYLKLICRYYDENTLNWTTTGCLASAIDLNTRIMTCNCDHATMFSILQGNDCVSENLYQCVNSITIEFLKMSILTCISMNFISILIFNYLLIA